MKKIFVIIFIIQAIISGCQVDTFHYYKEDVAELTRDQKTRKIQGNENNINDLSGCNYLLELGRWQREDDKKWGISWFRRNVWRDGSVNNYKIFGFNIKSELSSKITNESTNYSIYIGPWYHSPRINKTIRFFAYYPKDGGEINYQYESQTEENKNIPEKQFSLSPTAKYAPDNFGLCVVKWTAKFGYGAVAEVEYKGFFNKIFRLSPTPTGKIIEAKE